MIALRELRRKPSRLCRPRLEELEVRRLLAVTPVTPLLAQPLGSFVETANRIASLAGPGDTDAFLFDLQAGDDVAALFGPQNEDEADDQLLGLLARHMAAGR